MKAAARQAYPYIIRHATPSDIEASAKTFHETWVAAYSHLLSPQALDPAVLYPKLLKSREEITQQIQAGTTISLLIDLLPNPTPSPSVPRRPMSTFEPSTPLKIGGHCDIGLLDDYSNLTPNPPTKEDRTNTLEIQSLYVHVSMQGTGCARKLFTRAVREGLRRFPHVPRVVVLTFDVNEAAKKFYTSLEGTVWKQLGGYPDDGKLWDVVLYEWVDVEKWLQKWEPLYDNESK